MMGWEMTYFIVMGAMGGVMCLVVMLFLYCVVPAQERRAAARAQFEESPHEAAVRDAIWHATTDPEQCSHEDVLETGTRSSQAGIRRSTALRDPVF
jgi:type II secretory pathway component PulM